MILKTIKEKKLNSIIKKKLSKLEGGVAFSGNKLRSVLCLINYDEVTNINALYELGENLGVEKEDFKIIGYLKKIDRTEPYPIAVFSESAVLVNGVINNFKVNHYLEKEFDLVINFYDENILPLLLISTMAKANFRVGLGDQHTDFNDLALKGSVTDFDFLKGELIKYLRILNKK